MCECWYFQLISRLAMGWKDPKIPLLLTHLFKSLKTFNSHVHLTPKPCFITSHCEQSNLASVLKLKFIFFLWFLSLWSSICSLLWCQCSSSLKWQRSALFSKSSSVGQWRDRLWTDQRREKVTYQMVPCWEVSSTGATAAIMLVVKLFELPPPKIWFLA